MKTFISILLVLFTYTSWGQNYEHSTSSEPTLALSGQTETQLKLNQNDTSSLNKSIEEPSSSNKAILNPNNTNQLLKPKLKIMENSVNNGLKDDSKIKSTPELKEHSVEVVQKPKQGN